jgi:beta-lactamase class A
MMARASVLALLIAVSCSSVPARRTPLTIGYDTPVDAAFQRRIESIDARLRAKLDIPADATDVGVLDLERGRLAMIHPDQIEYAASVAKIGILFANFQLHPEEATRLTPETRHELGLMIKSSSNVMAAKYSRAMGLREIQEVLNAAGFYDASRGGGIWVGKHYGPNSERIGDPVADHSHAVTVRQVLRFYSMLEEGALVSPAASKTMLEIFLSPDIPHDEVKFVKGLSGRGLTIRRKLGTYEDWLHDTAIIDGRGRHYILVALTHHASGDRYLEELAAAVDDLMKE